MSGYELLVDNLEDEIADLRTEVVRLTRVNESTEKFFEWLLSGERMLAHRGDYSRGYLDAMYEVRASLRRLTQQGTNE